MFSSVQISDHKIRSLPCTIHRLRKFTYSPTADLATDKLLLNSVIYTNGACFICIDLSNFYLITPFNNKRDHEYDWIPEWVIPEKIIE